jgi:glycosyltransferase involved in cell wall biosynthesis
MIILTSGDNPKTSTGYGQIWDNLLSRWARDKPDWKFYHIGWQSRDREYQTREGYYILPINKVEYGFDMVESYLLKYKPDVFLTMTDIGLSAGFIDGVKAAKLKGWTGRWFAISLVDTETWEYNLWSKILDFPDKVIAGAKNGELLFAKHNVKNVVTIPMGVDTATYKPLGDKNNFKASHGLSNKFIAGFVGKNQRRKVQPYLIKGFAKFAKGKNDVKLLLHTDLESPAGWSIPCLLSKFENEVDSAIQRPDPKVIMTNPNLDVIARQRIGPEQMNEIFNLMDVYCYAVGGEGFGMPGVECQAAGVPLMMTDYSSACEIMCDDDLRIPVLKDKYDRLVTEIGTNGVENAVPDDNAIAEILEKLYKEWKEVKIEERNKRARDFSLKYDWNNISNRWIKLFEEG